MGAGFEALSTGILMTVSDFACIFFVPHPLESNNVSTSPKLLYTELCRLLCNATAETKLKKKNIAKGTPSIYISRKNCFLSGMNVLEAAMDLKSGNLFGLLDSGKKAFKSVTAIGKQ